MRRPLTMRGGLRAVFTVGAAAAVVSSSLFVPSAGASPTATSPLGHELALTPPMGFNNWARFGCRPDGIFAGDEGISESLILDQANALVDKNLARKGYDTVTVDDCWMTQSRDASGNLVPDPTLFPHGMKWLGDQLHAKGLKFGIYEDIGSYTCGGFPGSWGHFQQDVDQFASWGVDYIKLDGCNMPEEANSAAGYSKAYKDFGAAMKANASKRDMVFSESSPAYFFIGKSDLSDWYTVIDEASKSGQLWREGYDIKMYRSSHNAWNHNGNQAGIMTQYAYNSQLARYSAPGSWNDPDFLITGDALTDEESRTQFALWSMMAAPLILSVDVANLSPASLATLSNTDIIAIDQDRLGKQAGIVSQNGTVDVLARPLAGGDRAVALLNRGSSTATLSTTLTNVGFQGGAACTASVKDLWTSSTSPSSGTISASVPAHGTAIFRVQPGAGCTGQQPTGQISGIGGKCLDDANSATAPGNPVTLYSCHGGANQRWTVHGDGTIRALGACLDASYQSGDSRYVGYWAVVNPCDGRASQKWSYERNGYLKNTGLNLCADDFMSVTADTNPIIVGTCGVTKPNQGNQIWVLPV